MNLPELVDETQFPVEDSENLTDDRIEGAFKVKNLQECIAILKRVVIGANHQVLGHELLRRGEDLYWRVLLKGPDGMECGLIFQANWLCQEE